MKKKWFVMTIATMLLGCSSGADFVPNVNPEFKEQMKGKTIGEATGTPSLWGQTETSVASKIKKIKYITSSLLGLLMVAYYFKSFL